MCGRLDSYILAFSHLPDVYHIQSGKVLLDSRNVNRPLLLLAILEMIDKKIIRRNFIEPSTTLEDSYSHFFSHYPAGQNSGNAAQAFIELQSTDFWQLRLKQGANNHMQKEVRSLEQLRRSYWGATFSEDLYPLLVMEGSRKKLEKTLIESYLSTGGN